MERNSILDKIRALLNKTTSNGCTEFEALAALDKARAMMDAYEVTEADLALSKAESAILREDPSRDPHNIKTNMAVSVSKFCDCKVWKSNKKLVFCGLPSDAEFAEWLLASLGSFVQSELANHLMGCIAPKGERRFVINGFVAGCTNRINARLNELQKQSQAQASSNSTALVVIKGAAVAEKMAALNLRFRSGRRSTRRSNAESYAAGKTAGERASFGRPVSGGQSFIGG